MTRKIIYLILPLLLLAFVSTVKAQNTTTESAQQTTVDPETKLNQQLQLLREQKNTALANVKAAIQAKRDEFKAKLQLIKDQKKKTLVERIDAKLSSVNAKHTKRYTRVLNNLQTILDRLNIAGTQADVLANIAKAQDAINAAESAVESQTAKTYIITISAETNLRSDVGAIISQLRKDLVATYKAVINAKQAVQALNGDDIIKKKTTNSANL